MCDVASGDSLSGLPSICLFLFSFFLLVSLGRWTAIDASGSLTTWKNQWWSPHPSISKGSIRVFLTILENLICLASELTYRADGETNRRDILIQQTRSFHPMAWSLEIGKRFHSAEAKNQPVSWRVIGGGAFLLQRYQGLVILRHLPQSHWLLGDGGMKRFKEDFSAQGILF